MSWKEEVNKLELLNEQKFLRVQDKVNVAATDYYKILMKKYEEENNQKLYKVVREFEYMLRDDRERKKDWQ